MQLSPLPLNSMIALLLGLGIAGCPCASSESRTLDLQIAIVAGDKARVKLISENSSVPSMLEFEMVGFHSDESGEIFELVEENLSNSQRNALHAYLPYDVVGSTCKIILGHNIEERRVRIRAAGGTYQELEPGVHEIVVEFDADDAMVPPRLSISNAHRRRAL